AVVVRTPSSALARRGIGGGGRELAGRGGWCREGWRLRAGRWIGHGAAAVSSVAVAPFDAPPPRTGRSTAKIRSVGHPTDRAAPERRARARSIDRPPEGGALPCPRPSTRSSSPGRATSTTAPSARRR